MCDVPFWFIITGHVSKRLLHLIVLDIGRRNIIQYPICSTLFWFSSISRLCGLEPKPNVTESEQFCTSRIIISYPHYQQMHTLIQ